MSTNDPSSNQLPPTLLSGIPSSPGVASGPARIVRTGKPGSRLRPGEILVATVADPTVYLDIIENAVAVVCDLGGYVSHPAIVCRELGIPCVTATRNATEVLRDGLMVRVDGTKGLVRVED